MQGFGGDYSAGGLLMARVLLWEESRFLAWLE